MKFTNLNKRLDRFDSSRRYSSSSKKRFNRKTLLKIFGVVLILAVVIYLPVRGVYSSAKVMASASMSLQASLQTQKFDEMKKSLGEMESSASSINFSLNFLFWLRIIPFVGGYYSDIKGLAKAFEYELETGKILFDSLEPYKVELGFTGQPTPGQDKIAQMVKVLEKVNPKLPEVTPQLKKAHDSVVNIDVNKYPEKLGKYNVRSQVDSAKNFIVGSYIAVTQAKDALDQAPAALGQPNPKNYLIVFQNDKELRATGGFMTAYAFLKLDKGHLLTSQSDDIYRLDEKLLNTCLNVICPLTPPEPIVKYLPEANGKPRLAWSLRDANLSPDVPTSMRQFEKLYSFLKDGEKFDGIILIDTHVVEELIRITGPVDVFGTTYSAETDKRCNCPNVIYELESYAQIIEKGEQDRKAILGTLMQQLLAKALGLSTTKLPEFVNAAVKLANAKHTIFYMHDEKLQKALGKLNWTGEIRGFEADYLHISDSNFAGGKSNLYVTEDVNFEIDSDGKHKLTIKYNNPQPFNTWLNGINRDYVRIFVPRGAKLTSSKGSQDPVSTKEDEVLNKTYFEAFIQVRPQNSVTLSFEYEILSNVKADYLLIQKQPGTKNHKYELKINGKTKDSFELNSDKELKITL